MPARNTRRWPSRSPSRPQGTLPEDLCANLRGCGERLLDRARVVAGGVRADLTTDELFDLISAAAWVRENSPPGKDASPRLLELMRDGFMEPAPRGDRPG
ncbi:hypothetical protein [Pseudonocardia acaciae]|uniref:SbtR family transcriptional regulator n=1 Tax=Pseudonocardia acaciae TaxID=551276 RepID=UPI00048DA5E1|nr:hypothetical protein [Pseudonocardia acaciae]